ncbi:MAG: S8 family serine peptidase, partial [Anaerolineales bacterium]
MFTAAGGKFKTSPTLSADGSQVFAAVEERRLYALDAASGAQQWSYATLGNIKGSPTVDVDGHVIVASEGRDIVELKNTGTIVDLLPVGDRVSQQTVTTSNGDVYALVGDKHLVRVEPLTAAWNGRPDVLPSPNANEWDVVTKVSVDTGADMVHATLLNGTTPINGAGVTVAVIDSGIYFDKQTKSVMGGAIANLFQGQVDFVGTGKCAGGGQQKNGYCKYDDTESRDPYGHGSHVAGLIWNNFRDHETGTSLGVAPGAKILSVRVLDGSGAGSYTDVIEGIQYVVANKAAFGGLRVINLSLSGFATTPYFADPLDRAVEQAWAAGLVVLAAAGNTGPLAETISVPGNDPYVITVGAVNSNRTSGYWADDVVPAWSGTGPTLDGFAKPDVLAPGSNLVSFMYNNPRDGVDGANTANLAKIHPDYSANSTMFRMSGTSMATGVMSGIVALMLQANPGLTPDQVKYRLMDTARPAVTGNGDAAYNTLRQGLGRVWAPDAVLSPVDPAGLANLDMNLAADLAHAYDTEADLAFHYQGPVRKVPSDQGDGYLYYVEDANG